MHEIAHSLINLWVGDTRDAESRILILVHDNETVRIVEKWLNNEFDLIAPNMATSLHDKMSPFQTDLSIKLFFFSPPPLPVEGISFKFDIKYFGTSRI